MFFFVVVVVFFFFFHLLRIAAFFSSTFLQSPWLLDDAAFHLPRPKASPTNCHTAAMRKYQQRMLLLMRSREKAQRRR